MFDLNKISVDQDGAMDFSIVHQEDWMAHPEFGSWLHNQVAQTMEKAKLLIALPDPTTLEDADQYLDDLASLKFQVLLALHERYREWLSSLN